MAAGPWIASAACRAERTGTGGVCGPPAGRDDWPALGWSADGWPAAGWLLALALPAGSALPEPAAPTGELQPAVSATAVAAAAPPTVSQSR
jgi:hypothetical protein